MIVGNGLIASLFRGQDLQNVIFFASGVSNSMETSKEAFDREENLVRKTMAENPGKTLIYFSTCSVYDSSKTGSDYVLHKLKMEQIVKNTMARFLILRVSNAVGRGGNPNLLINYLVRSVVNGEPINVHTKATRNLIDAEDVRNITYHLIQQNDLNRIVNVAYPHNYTIIEILEILEHYFGLKVDLQLVKSGSGYEINIPETEGYFKEKNLTHKEYYLQHILEKYYAPNRASE